jgi:preprotein translocase subunit SecB
MPQRRNSPTKLNTGKNYEKFLRGLRLSGFGLEKCSAELDRAEYFELELKDRQNQITAHYGLTDIEKGFFNTSSDFILKVVDKNTSSVAFSVTCQFVGHFHFEGVVDVEHAEKFAQSELRLIVWPYFRQYVSDLTARMSLPPLIIPLQSPK